MVIRNSLDKPALVIFDLFGTLIKYGVMHHPFRPLLTWAKENGRRPTPADSRILMTTNEDVPALATALEINAPEQLIEQMQSHIQDELASLTLYEDARPTLETLQNYNIPMAICSNLAFPYGEAIDLLLDEYTFIRGLSYEIGFIKPESGIYHAVISQAQLPPQKCLFVGDTLLADYEGPVISVCGSFI